jgi:hypothetical protein
MYKIPFEGYIVNNVTGVIFLIMPEEIEYNPNEALLRNLDKKTITPDPKQQELEMLRKQLNKAKLFLEHLIFQEEVELLRSALGIPTEGFRDEEEAFVFLMNTDQKQFELLLKKLIKKHSVSGRWYMAFGYNLLLNTPEVPIRFIPPVMEMYVPNERDRLVLEIFKDTTLGDVKEIWQVIKQQQSALKPNTKTRSEKGVSLMVWDEETGKCKFVTAAPAKRNRSSDLYQRGELIVKLRSQGFSDNEIALQIHSNEVLTAKDVADIFYDYKNILNDINLQ